MTTKIKTKDIKQKIVLKASPDEVYEALMNSKKHTAFTGSKASISPKVGGKFNAYDGYIEGTNVELVPGKRIVQSWRADEWPEDHYSTAIFDLKGKGGKTELIFTQKGVPAEFHSSIKQGWTDFYWDPLEEYFS